MNTTYWFLLLWVLAFVAYCIFAALALPVEQTVSRALYLAARKHPALSFGMGFALAFLLGHVFWGHFE